MERRLSVEEYDVAVSDVSVDDIADLELFCKLDAVGVFDRSDIRKESKNGTLLLGAICKSHRNGTRVFIMTPENSFL